MFQTKVVGKIRTNFMFKASFFENSAVYEILWRNTVEANRLQMTNMAHGHCLLNI